MQPEPTRHWETPRDTPRRMSPTVVPEVFEVAFVCTANRFRSALANAVCAHLLTDVAARSSSFGVLRLEPGPALDGALRVAERLGLDLASHESRPLRTGSLATANLVVGFEHTHIEAAVVEGRASAERCFLLTELGALLETAGAGEIVPQPTPEEIVLRLEPARQLVSLTREFGSVPDPAGASPATQEASALRVVRLVVGATRAIFGPAVEERAAELEATLAKLQRGGRSRLSLHGLLPRRG